MSAYQLISIYADEDDLVELQTHADSKIRRELEPLWRMYPTDEFLISVANLHKTLLMRPDPTGIGVEYVEIAPYNKGDELGITPLPLAEEETAKLDQCMNRCLKFLYEEKDHEQTNQKETTKTNERESDSSECRSEDDRCDYFYGF